MAPLDSAANEAPRAWCNGCTRAFQALSTGSIPVARFTPRAPPRKRRGLRPGGGQRLVPRSVLNAPLELVHRRRCYPPGMPNDPYDLPNASALTAIVRRSAGGGQTLAVSTAALADPVCNSWHRRQLRLFPETVDPSRTTSEAPKCLPAHGGRARSSQPRKGGTCTSVSEHSSSSSCWSSSSSNG